MHKLSVFLIIAISLWLTACSSKSQKLEGFLEDVISLEGTKFHEHEPLKDVIPLLQQKATRSIELTKSNMGEAIQDASRSKYAIIVAGKHTIAKITDFDDVQLSTSWGTKLPMCKGYIQKKGDFEELHNYLSFIIGKPDGQRRVMYLFD